MSRAAVAREQPWYPMTVRGARASLRVARPRLLPRLIRRLPLPGGARVRAYRTAGPLLAQRVRRTPSTSTAWAALSAACSRRSSPAVQLEVQRVQDLIGRQVGKV